MDRQYYKAYYQLERKHWWFRVRERIIRERISTSINQNRNLEILNIGAATGRSSQMLERYGNVTSLEYDKVCCDFVKEKLGINVVNGSITNLPFDSKAYDLVCAFDVIEHVEDHDMAIAEMKRVCKDEGTLCVTVPAYMSLWSEHDVVNKHFRRYTLKELLELFGNSQLKEIYSSYFNTLLFLPIYAFRQVSKIIPEKYLRKGSGSDFELKTQFNLVDSLLRKIFGLEIVLLRYLKFSFGVSIITIWRK